MADLNRSVLVRGKASSHRGRRRRTGTGLIATLLALVLCPGASAGVIEYTTGITSADKPTDVVQGSDGNVWFSEPGTGRMARITPTGTVTQFSAGITAGREPYRVAKGADGNVWFTERGASDAYVGRITPTGVVQEFVLGPGQAGDITAGPDGNLWARVGASTVYRITTAGVATPFSTGLDSVEQDGITAGPDGNLWMTGASGINAMTGVVGRITPTGTPAPFHTGIDPGSSRAAIAAGSDGNLWFTGYGVIYRITTAGVVTKFVVSATPRDYMRDMALGADNALWATRENFSTTTGGSVFRIATDGSVAEVTCGITPGARLNGITPGPGGDLWIAAEAGRIIRLPTNPASCPPVNTGLPQLTGVAYPDHTLTCSTGTWTGSPTSYDYQWLYDGFVLIGQTASTLLVLDDALYIGRDLSCRVTAHNTGGAGVAVSAPLRGAYDPLVPSIQTPPQATGTGRVGDVVSCSAGSWTNTPTSYSYQWYDQNATPAAAISGATNPAYSVDAAYDDHELFCKVKASNASGNSRAASSNRIYAFRPYPEATISPSISPQPARVGDTLACNVGTWTENPTNYVVSWRQAVDVVLATSTATYVVTAADAGRQVFCRVVATNAFGKLGEADSASVTPTAAMAPPPAALPVPPPPVAPLPPVTDPAPRAPTLTARSTIARSSLAKGIVASVSNVPAGATVTLRVLSGARTLATRTIRTTGASAVRLVAKLTKRQRARVKKGAKLKLRVTIRPSSGTATTLTKTLRVV